jgi:hypothetical protein
MWSCPNWLDKEARPEWRRLGPELERIGLLTGVDGPGEDTFEFVVCTPAWLAERVSDGHHVFGFPDLIVSEYHYEHIFGAISTLCSRIVGTTWQEVAAQLGRYGQWEFEDYVQPI